MWKSKMEDAKRCNRHKAAPALVLTTSAKTLFVQQTWSQDPALERAIRITMKKQICVFHRICWFSRWRGSGGRKDDSAKKIMQKLQVLAIAGKQHQRKSCSRPTVFIEKLFPPEVLHAKTAPALVLRGAAVIVHANWQGIRIADWPPRRNAPAQMSENKSAGFAKLRVLTRS